MTESLNPTTIDEDEWWETVAAEQDMRALLLGCEHQCLTVACRCRAEAITCVTKLTSVNYDGR